MQVTNTGVLNHNFLSVFTMTVPTTLYTAHHTLL